MAPPRRVMAVLTALAFAAACTDDDSVTSTRGPVELDADVHLVAPDRLQLGVLSCHGDPEVTELSQDDGQVRIEVTSTVSSPGDACMDVLTVALDAPLGDRAVVDATSGRTLRVVRAAG
jgi:hypothetical protein